MTAHAVGIRYPPSLSVAAIMIYAERLKGAHSSTPRTVGATKLSLADRIKEQSQ